VTNLPTKSKPEPVPVEVEEIPTWRELGDRFRDLIKDIGAELGDMWKQEGKDFSREAEARALSALKRTKLEIEKLISRLEERVAKYSAERAAKPPSEG
jgi:hypothetical protein